MLDLIRKKQKSIIIKVVFWAIIATFVGTIFLVWGKGSERDGRDATVAVTVDKTRIGFDDYLRATEAAIVRPGVEGIYHVGDEEPVADVEHSRAQ